ncbi:MAG: serine/threonine protein kinase [Alphaproteobacteria bacterium]|nr:serine/threonine protein kinase [Alphaproteobacteria bacterium]
MAQPAPMEQFGKYQILERIARGGMAEIFKARMEGIGGFNRLFAIKRIVPGLSQNREYIDLLVDEAKIAGLLSHANIVQILDLGQVSGQYYVAMEYVEGRDLGTVLHRCRERGITLPVPHAVFILIEVLKGLEYAHNRQIMRGNRPMPLNIVHRDVSPSNVLVSFQGEVKLTDFGIAKANVKAMETLSGVIKGKFDYMSPEQASGHAIDQRTDLFAAGVLLYEMLCGQHPFRQSHEMKTIAAIRAGQYQPPSFANPDVPYGLEVVLDQALARDPDDRFPTATAFKDALTKFFHDAGFIFSHSTLAAFLKGLFPEANVRRRRGEQKGKVLNLRDQETRPLAEEDDDLDSERPTTLEEDVAPAPPRPAPPRPVAQRPAPTPPRAAPPRPPPAPSVATPPVPEGGHSTIVRRRAPPRRTRPVIPLVEANPSVEPTHTNPGEALRASAPPQRLPKPPPPSGVFEARRPPRALSPNQEGDTLLREIPPEKVRTARPKGSLPAPQRSIIPEESTLIRQPDAAMRQALDEAQAQARIDEWNEDKPTSIRGGLQDVLPTGKRPSPRGEQPISVELELDDDELSLDEATQSHSATLELDEPSIAGVAPPPRIANLRAQAPAPAPAPVAAPAPAPARAGRPSVAFLVAAAFIGATLGVMVGMALGAFVGWQLRDQSVAAAAPAVQLAAPRVSVTAPEGARIFVGDRLRGVSGGAPVSLPAVIGEPLEIKIELDDVVIHEGSHTLVAGETVELHLLDLSADE